MSFTFLQYVGAWANHLYPTGNKKKSTYATSGCGTCMLADIIYNVNPNITPEIVGKYISSIGGATPGGATYHWAIKKTAEHFGLHCKEIGTMSEYRKIMTANDYWGGLLFDKGTRGGIKWTAGGHYIANTAIKNNDLLYMRDSGKRKHIGWYSYSKHIKGLIKKAWVFWIDNNQKPAPAQPTLTANQKAINAAVQFAKDTANNNKYGYKVYNKTDHKCPICHPSTKVKGFNCIGFVAACFAHGAGDSRLLANCKNNNGSALGNNATLTNVTLTSWRKKNGAKWEMITNGGARNGKDIAASKLKAGDVLIGYNRSGKYQHTMLYIGNGKIIDAVSSGSKPGQISQHDYATRCKSLYITRAFRYTGGGRYGN